MEAPRPQWGELFGTHRDQLSSTNQLSGCLISPRKRFLYKGVMGKRVGSRSRWMERAILWSWSPWTPVGSPKDGTGGVGLAAPCCSERSLVFPSAWVISEEGKLRAAGGPSPSWGSVSLAPNNQTRHELKETEESSITNPLEVVTNRASFNFKIAARIQWH